MTCPKIGKALTPCTRARLTLPSSSSASQLSRVCLACSPNFPYQPIFEELCLRPTAADIFIAADAAMASRGGFFGDAVGISPDVGTVFRLKSLNLTPLTNASDVRDNDPRAVAELVWKPDVNLLNLKDLMHVTKHFGELLLIIERITLACMIESTLLLAERHTNDKLLLNSVPGLTRYTMHY